MSSPIFKKELSVVQKMFNQRLLAAHAWTEAQAHHIYTQELLPTVSNDHDAVDRVSLTETIQCCNGHLSDFGLEIVSITLPDYTKLQVNDHDDDDEEEEAQDDEEEDTEDRPPSNSKSSRRSTSSTTTPATISTTIKYYTIINQCPDAIAKEIYQPFLFQPNGTLQGYVQHVVWHLSQQYPTPAARATILNLKNSIPNSSRSTTNPMEVAVVETMVPPSSTASTSVVLLPSPKVTLSQAEDMLERLLDEQWLMEVVVLSATKNRRTSSSSSSHNAKIALGPRALGELSYLLQSSSSAAENDDNEPDKNVNDRQPPRSSSSSSKWNVLLPQPIYIRY